ncbi:MAG: S41 family peptidase [Flavobacteriales bacterium]
MMKQLLCLALTIGSVSQSFAQVDAPGSPLWLRNPAISPDGTAIVFTYQGDLWRVPATGGRALLLTTNEAMDGSPVWSHDGEQIAFASNRYGNNDIFIMPSEGGPSTRLTFNSAWDMPSDFTPDNSAVIFYSSRMDAVSNQLFPSGAMGELYAVPVKGGRATCVTTLPALNAKYNKAGDKLVYHDRKGYEDELRKHHTSSVTRDIWTLDPVKMEYKKITTFIGEDVDPVWSADGASVYYLSEDPLGATDGRTSFNICKVAATGGTPTRISQLKDHPVRSLSISDNGKFCFSYDGELYTMTEGSQPEKVNVNIETDGRYNPVSTLSVNGNISELEVSPNGKEVVYVSRGEVFVSSVAEGTTRRITNTPQQERSVSFSPDGRGILFAAERNDSWDIYTVSLTRNDENFFFNSTVLKEEALIATPAEEFQPRWSPDGKEVAYFEERTEVKVFNLASKETRTVLPGDRNYSYSDGDQHFAWSPDSKWLLVQFLRPDQWLTQCGLVNASGKDPVIDLTKSGYDHWSPDWAMDGKVMISVSGRDGMKNHASWGGQADVYATFFTQEAYDHFKLTKEEADLKKEAEEKEEEGGEDADKDKKKDKKDAKEEEPVKPLKFELDNIVDRRERLTIHSSDLGAAVLSKDGEKLYYLASFEKGYDLWETELRTHETKVLTKLGADDMGTLVMDKEGKNLYFTNDGSISVFDIEKGEVKGVGVNGEMTLNANEERAYLFEHVWRQVVKKFYRVDLHGVDWEFYKKAYSKFLPFINNNEDFAEMLSEMLGELDASHTGSGFRSNMENGDATASLGLFYLDDTTKAGLVVAEVIEKSPVIRDGSKIKKGTVIEKIDGVELSVDQDPSTHFNRKADKYTLLSLYDPATKARWEETVKPITRGEESELLYQRWVKRCRHIVDSLSNGTIGYVHVRGMDDESYRTVYEDALGRYYDKKALVVDTRFNGGGWLHDDLATFLSGKTYMREEPRGQKLGTEPQFKWQRPSAVVMGESNYSDAHMFPVTYRALGVGKLVGMPVPGTGTAVWWEGLQNGMYFGIPQVGMIDNAGNYLENQQLEPDIRQELEPAIVSKGRDQQLEAAVKLLMGN